MIQREPWKTLVEILVLLGAIPAPAAEVSYIDRSCLAGAARVPVEFVDPLVTSAKPQKRLESHTGILGWRRGVQGELLVQRFSSLYVSKLGSLSCGFV